MAEGVSHIFGVVGSSYVEVLDAMYRVSMATNGPGTTNLVTGVGGAYLAPAPMVVMAGAPMVNHIGRGAIQTGHGGS